MSAPPRARNAAPSSPAPPRAPSAPPRASRATMSDTARRRRAESRLVHAKARRREEEGRFTRRRGGAEESGFRPPHFAAKMPRSRQAQHPPSPYRREGRGAGQCVRHTRHTELGQRPRSNETIHVSASPRKQFDPNSH